MPIPPMPPMPPPWLCPAPSSFFGASAMAASVVIIRPATEAASCSAVRTTLAGSMTPLLHHVDVLVGLGVEAEGWPTRLQHLADHDRAFDAGVLGDLADRGLQRAAHDGDAGFLVVVVALEAVQALAAFSSATPPPGTMPSSTAARVALRASSTRSFFSFTSTSVAPPTRITATPPASLARRSCSFSLS